MGTAVCFYFKKRSVYLNEFNTSPEIEQFLSGCFIRHISSVRKRNVTLYAITSAIFQNAH